MHVIQNGKSDADYAHFVYTLLRYRSSYFLLVDFLFIWLTDYARFVYRLLRSRSSHYFTRIRTKTQELELEVTTHSEFRDRPWKV